MSLYEIQSDLDEHLTPKTLRCLIENITHSKSAYVIAKALVMLLGIPYPTADQCRHALSKKNVIEEIKNLHRKRVRGTEKLQMAIWMETESSTFDAKHGFQGYKPLQVLRDWIIYVVQQKSEKKAVDLLLDEGEKEKVYAHLMEKDGDKDIEAAINRLKCKSP